MDAGRHHTCREAMEKPSIVHPFWHECACNGCMMTVTSCDALAFLFWVHAHTTVLRGRVELSKKMLTRYVDFRVSVGVLITRATTSYLHDLRYNYARILQYSILSATLYPVVVGFIVRGVCTALSRIRTLYRFSLPSASTTTAKRKSLSIVPSES